MVVELVEGSGSSLDLHIIHFLKTNVTYTISIMILVVIGLIAK